MDDIFVARLMSSTVHSVPPDTLVEEAANRMLEAEIGSVVVVNSTNRLEGIITTTDFVQIVAERKPKDRTPVSHYMTTDVITIGPQDTIREVAEIMVDNGISHVPVITDEREVIGMISTTDLTNYISNLPNATIHP